MITSIRQTFSPVIASYLAGLHASLAMNSPDGVFEEPERRYTVSHLESDSMLFNGRTAETILDKKWLFTVGNDYSPLRAAFSSGFACGGFSSVASEPSANHQTLIEGLERLSIWLGFGDDEIGEIMSDAPRPENRSFFSVFSHLARVARTNPVALMTGKNLDDSVFKFVVMNTCVTCREMLSPADGDGVLYVARNIDTSLLDFSDKGFSPSMFSEVLENHELRFDKIMEDERILHAVNDAKRLVSDGVVHAVASRLERKFSDTVKYIELELGSRKLGNKEREALARSASMIAFLRRDVDGALAVEAAVNVPGEENPALLKRLAKKGVSLSRLMEERLLEPLRTGTESGAKSVPAKFAAAAWGGRARALAMLDGRYERTIEGTR